MAQCQACLRPRTARATPSREARHGMRVGDVRCACVIHGKQRCAGMEAWSYSHTDAMRCSHTMCPHRKAWSTMMGHLLAQHMKANAKAAVGCYFRCCCCLVAYPVCAGAVSLTKPLPSAAVAHSDGSAQLYKHMTPSTEPQRPMGWPPCPAWHPPRVTHPARAAAAAPAAPS